MADYTHEYSNFPSTVMDKKTYRNVTNSDATLINKIKEYQKDKDYISAAKLINANPSIKQCMPDCSDFNALNEEIRNAEIYAKTIKQSVFYMEDQPSTPNNSDVWIGGMNGL